MKIYLFNNFSKRENSTKQPLITSGTQFDCTLKEPTSAIRPTVIISKNGSNTFQNYGYAYIPDFYRWYWITDMISDGPFWVYSMETDVLATYKAQIGAWPFYVLRSSAESNGKIVDGSYPGLADYVVDNTSSVTYSTTLHKSTPWNITPSSGCYILGMQSEDASMGSIKYIALSQSNMQALCHELATNAVTSPDFDFSQITQALTKQIVDPLQFIKSAIWIPLNYSIFGTLPDVTTLETGYMSFNVTYKDISAGGYLWWGSLLAFPLADHPQVSRGIYLNGTPFTDRYLFAPPFGMININNENTVGHSYIAVNYRVDMITGMGDITVYATDDPKIENTSLTDNLITRVTAQVGVPITLTQAVTDFIGMVHGTIQAITGAALLSPTMMAGGLLNTLESKQPRLSSTGGTGGIAGLGMTWRLYSLFTKIASEDNADIGRPLCAVKTPSSIPGFIQVRQGDINLPNATSGEHAAVKEYLESGFWYE